MVSKRILNLKLSIWEIKERASKIDDCIRFDFGQSNFKTPKHVNQAAIRAIKEGFTSFYAPLFGIPELREAIAERWSKRQGLHLKKENVLITNGITGAFMSTFLSLDPGDEVILPDPSYEGYRIFAEVAKLKPIYARFFDDEGKFCPKNIEAKITKRTKFLVVNTPHNPTGYVLNENVLKKIAKLAKVNNLILISDEIYHSMLYDGVKHICSQVCS